MRMTKSTQTNLAKPPMSWLRKMSANTVISSQIQMKNMKNQSIDQKTWPVPKSLAIPLALPFSVTIARGCSVSAAPPGARIIPPG